MRWVTSFAALGLMMALFHRLTAAGPVEARATLALGFLLLAAYLGGGLAARARLPRVTAYLLVGFCVGPAWLGLVRADEVRALDFLADAAVALIAFAVGTELRLETLRLASVRTPLLRATAGTIVLPFLFVALVTLSVSPWFPITVHQPFRDAIAVALVLGTVAATSSPALTMAVVEELGARGPFARTLLAVSVAKDVVVIALLSLVFAVARVVGSPGTLNPGVAGTLLLRLGGSVAAGALLGLGVARYLRLVRRGTVIFLVALAFLAAEIARVLDLETVLIAVTAGVVAANVFRSEGDELVRSLRQHSLPVYVILFGLAGAGLQVGALQEAGLWWIVLLVGLRVWGLRYGTRWTAAGGGGGDDVTPAIARYGWLGLISQGGVAMSLAAAARRAFPEWGVSLEALLVAMLGVHEVVGPICLRRALVRAGEVTEGLHVESKPEVGGEIVAAARSGGGV